MPMDRTNNIFLDNIISYQNLSSVNHPSNQQQSLDVTAYGNLQRQHFHNILQIQQQIHQQLQQQQQRQQQQLQQSQHLSQLHQANIANSNNNTNNNHHNNNNNNQLATNGNNKITRAPPPKKELIDLVTCGLCKGYLIDAVTLDLCMHSFCKACAIKSIRENPRCPECYIEIKDKRSLHRLKNDHKLQNIVYKLVPGLYEKEMARRRKFYAARPSQTPRHANEMFGDIPPCKAIKPDHKINVSITWNKDCLDEPIKTYLYCRADCTMLVLKKLIVGKFGLDRPIKIYYGKSEIFFDLTTIMDVAATYNWKPEEKILNFTFSEVEKIDIPITNSSIPSNSGHDLLNGPSKNPC